MKIASLVSADGSSMLVTADGKPLGNSDVDRRMLHVLPKLFVPSGVARLMAPSDCELLVEWSLDEPVPELKVRQPYPNTRYYVGGTETMRNGWLVAVPENIYEVKVVFRWSMPRASKFSAHDHLAVVHTILITLLPGEHRTYTMDSTCWPREMPAGEGRPALERTPVSKVGFEEDEGLNEHGQRDIVLDDELIFFGYDDDKDRVGRQIVERLSIPPVAYEQVWSLYAFDELQLHELAPVSSFTTFREEHSNNGVIEMPPAIFLSAIQQAQDVPFGKGTVYSQGKGACEKHPALKVMNDWWCSNRPAESKLMPGHAMPWVRVEDDEHYHCGYHETPSMGIPAMHFGRNSAAVVGDYVLLQFVCSAEHMDFKDDCLQIYLADGQLWLSIGVGPDELESGVYDEAWYALEALQRFPHRFRKAFEALQQQAIDEARSAAETAVQ